MYSASENIVRVRLGVNLSDGPGGAATTGLKYLALFENISGSRGVGWR